jgi:hypothetical protein
MKNLWSNLKSGLFNQPLSQEAFEAYFHRLPDDLEVSWFRDGKFIIGNIKAGENKFVTQGLDAEDFIDMVNDAVITVFGVPKQYYDAIRQTHTYIPPKQQLEQLRNASVKKATIFLEKNKKVAQLA